VLVVGRQPTTVAPRNAASVTVTPVISQVRIGASAATVVAAVTDAASPAVTSAAEVAALRTAVAVAVCSGIQAAAATTDLTPHRKTTPHS
jgi:hypothetical protein